MSATFARLSRAPAPCIRILRQNIHTTPTRAQRQPIPTTPTCPPPTCACASTPPDLAIDRTSPLLNTVAAYASQVVLCTGTSDWPSNIEQEGGATGEFVKGLKGIVGRGGEAFDPFNNVLITASDIPASQTPNTTTALLFPAFKRIPVIPHSPSSYRAFATAYLKAESLHPMHDGLSADQKAKLSRDESAARILPQAEDITTPTILICGHATRDSRCGALGPLLQHSFEKEFARRGIDAHVAQISHIGGHKFAGNVIVYLPPAWGNALSGAGIWYGRVGPESVEGLVGETVVGGRVVRDMVRGGRMAGGGDLGRGVEGMEREEKGEDGKGGLRLEPRDRR
ncbi:hypothetical protein CC86DRAFT_466924 [Ophiobolus disseminans]|uniref:Altered inheritance of mitochondria protein 32 n=1 Tax=Ophiobolus disseminans TaxID=1469910 RepID=A0A6A6ZYK0_9PLEO|nr:hypothetical protein CC86DRAFT_466924 [Ophiobolus disseminans]